MTLAMLCIFLVKVLWQKQPVQFILLARIAGSGSGRKRQCFRLELGPGVRTKFGLTNPEIQIFDRNHRGGSMQGLF